MRLLWGRSCSACAAATIHALLHTPLTSPPVTNRSDRLSVSLTAHATLYVPRPPEGAVIVGVVIRGIEIGALARCADGSFVKVNGDVVTRLNPRHVQAALNRARPPRPRADTALTPPPTTTVANAPSVVVVIKKRRRIATPV